MRVRKKPVEVEAVRFAGTAESMIFDDAPDWLVEAVLKNPSELGAVYKSGNGAAIHTLEGEHFASPGDWIIRGVKGELYPCKPDIFEQTYERIE